MYVCCALALSQSRVRSVATACLRCAYCVFSAHIVSFAPPDRLACVCYSFIACLLRGYSLVDKSLPRIYCARAMCLPQIDCAFAACLRFFCCVFTARRLRVYCALTVRSLRDYCAFSLCVPCIHYVFTTRLLGIRSVAVVCSSRA